jgi:hypothetical protein
MVDYSPNLRLPLYYKVNMRKDPGMTYNLKDIFNKLNLLSPNKNPTNSHKREVLHYL